MGNAETVSLAIAASSLAGVLTGISTALVYLMGSLLLPGRVALLIALCAGLAASIPRSTLIGWHQPLHAGSALAIGVLMLIKVEVISEIDPEWIPVTLICSTCWARAVSISARRDPIVGLPAASAGSRLLSLAIGMAPLAFFGLWPQPVWGLWVAAVATFVLALRLSPRGWAAPLAPRWVALETLFCLCVLALMSAAALGEFTEEETPGS